MNLKRTLILLLFPFLMFGQTQIGEDIFQESFEDSSGYSLSLSSDGNVLAIGAILNNNGGGLNAGHVRVFRNINNNWVQIGEDIDGEAANDSSGSSISLSSNGNIIAIGAYRNNGNGVNSGHVRIFKNIDNVWTQIGEDIDGEYEFDNFGESVDLYSDGNIVAISTSGNDDNGINSGHVRIYEYLNGSWLKIGQDIDGEATEDNIGSVSLSSDGTIVAFGASGNNGNGINSGHVRVFENIDNVWTQLGQDIDGEAAEDFSGVSISLSNDGNIIAIGAGYNDGGGVDSGHVRVYNNNNNTWIQVGEDIDGEFDDVRLGFGVSLSGDGNILAILSANDGRIFQNESGN